MHPSATTDATPGGVPNFSDGPQRPPEGRGRFEREWHAITELAHSLKAITAVQMRLWLLRVKSAAVRLMVGIVLWTLALVATLLGVIFLYIGCFHVLTDVLHIAHVWAFLIFAGVHLCTAAGLIYTHQWLGRRGNRKGTPNVL